MKTFKKSWHCFKKIKFWVNDIYSMLDIYSKLLEKTKQEMNSNICASPLERRRQNRINQII